MAVLSSRDLGPYRAEWLVDVAHRLIKAPSGRELGPSPQHCLGWQVPSMS